MATLASSNDAMVVYTYALGQTGQSLSDGSLVGEAHPLVTNGLDLVIAQDSLGRTSSVTWKKSGQNGDVLDAYSYTYDSSSNRETRKNEYTVNNTRITGFDEKYGYDGLGRLIGMQRGTLSGQQINNPTYSQGWTLDDLGNWTEYTDNGTGKDHSVDEANHLTGIEGGVTPLYDAVGNMIYGPRGDDATAGLHYKFDAWNRLVEVTQGSGESATTVAKYEYDGIDYRIAKTDYTGESAVRYDYYYDTGYQVVQTYREQTTGSHPLDTYVWDARYVDAMVVRFHDGNTDGDCTGGSAEGDNVLYPTTDANFDITAVVDATPGSSTAGEVVERYTYTPYGVRTILSDWNTTLTTSAFNWTNAHQGLNLDTETGLYYNRARYYDPATGVFRSQDPAQSGPNTYEYCGSNPLVSTDPQGLWYEEEVLQECKTWENGKYGTFRVTLETWGGWYESKTLAIGANQYRQTRKFVPDAVQPASKAEGNFVFLIDKSEEMRQAAESLAGSLQTTINVIDKAGYVIPGIHTGMRAGELASKGEYGEAAWTFTSGVAIETATIYVGGKALKIGGKLVSGARRAVGAASEAVGSGGRGLVGFVKASGKVDPSIAQSYLRLIESPQFAKSLQRYNVIARKLGLKQSASIEKIRAALTSDTTFSRTSNILAGLFEKGEHSALTRFLIQGNPLTRYGPRAARHELTHLGAALEGQGDTLLHEIAVQAATTPEVLAGGALVLLGTFSGIHYLTK